MLGSSCGDAPFEWGNLYHQKKINKMGKYKEAGYKRQKAVEKKQDITRVLKFIEKESIRYAKEFYNENKCKMPVKPDKGSSDDVINAWMDAKTAIRNNKNIAIHSFYDGAEWGRNQLKTKLHQQLDDGYRRESLLKEEIKQLKSKLNSESITVDNYNLTFDKSGELIKIPKN